MVEQMKYAKTWREFIEAQSIVRFLENVVINLIQNEIREEE